MCTVTFASYCCVCCCLFVLLYLLLFLCCVSYLGQFAWDKTDDDDDDNGDVDENGDDVPTVCDICSAVGTVHEMWRLSWSNNFARDQHVHEPVARRHRER